LLESDIDEGEGEDFAVDAQCEQLVQDILARGDCKAQKNRVDAVLKNRHVRRGLGAAGTPGIRNEAAIELELSLVLHDVGASELAVVATSLELVNCLGSGALAGLDLELGIRGKSQIDAFVVRKLNCRRRSLWGLGRRSRRRRTNSSIGFGRGFDNHRMSGVGSFDNLDCCRP